MLEIIYARNPPVFDPTKHLTLKLTKNCTGLDFLFLNKIGFFLQVVACGFPQIPLIVSALCGGEKGEQFLSETCFNIKVDKKIDQFRHFIFKQNWIFSSSCCLWFSANPSYCFHSPNKKEY